MIGSAALVFLLLGAWTTWWMMGRALRPVAAIRARMSELTVDDLSLRVPVPPGRGEIVLLARRANRTLVRLEGAVEQQRRFASTTSHELRIQLIRVLGNLLSNARRHADTRVEVFVEAAQSQSRCLNTT